MVETSNATLAEAAVPVFVVLRMKWSPQVEKDGESSTGIRIDLRYKALLFKVKNTLLFDMRLFGVMEDRRITYRPVVSPCRDKMSKGNASLPRFPELDQFV
jgi:hypothetical protein